MSAQYFNIITAPHFSEKSNNVAQYNQYVFKVAMDSDKAVIKRSIESLFDVKVESVQVTNVKGKTKRHGRIMGRRKDWKKAYVKLKPGHTIDVSGASA